MAPTAPGCERPQSPLATPPGNPYTPAQLGDAFQAIEGGEDIDYKGASGNVDFDQNGNVRSGFIVWEAYRTGDKTTDYRTDAHFALDELVVQIQ